MRVYIINGHDTRMKRDDISYFVYFNIYAANTGVILYWNPDQPFLYTETIMFDLMNICSRFDQVRPVASHIEVHLPNKPLTPNSICKGLKGHQRKLFK